jgi:hypothetical protein
VAYIDDRTLNPIPIPSDNGTVYTIKSFQGLLKSAMIDTLLLMSEAKEGKGLWKDSIEQLKALFAGIRKVEIQIDVLKFWMI